MIKTVLPKQFHVVRPLQILVIIKHLRIEIVSKKRPAGRDDLSSIIGLDGEYVAGAFMAVEGFHMHLK